MKNKKKLNNILSSKDYFLDKLKNQPGKVLEKNIFTKIDDYRIKSSTKNIKNHPMKNKIYQNLLKTDPERAKKYINFWKNGDGVPVWDDKLNKYVDRSFTSSRGI